MAGGFGAGLAGLAFVPQGYTQGGMNWLQLQNAETDQAAQVALGKGMQSLIGAPSGATPGQLPGSQPIGGAPGGGVGGGPGGPPPMMPPSGGSSFAPPQPSPMGRPSPFAGPAGAPPAGGPAMPPGPPAPTVQGGPGGLPPMAGGPPMGGGQPGQGPMTWQAVAQAVTRANPGAPPEVIAAAVTKAMPLMQADSQQQWRLVQQQMQQQRIEQGYDRMGQQQGQFETREAGRREGAAEKVREFDTREDRLHEALDFRKDTKARELQMKEEQARQRATSLQASTDQKARAEAIKEWQAQYNAYDKYMRSRINAQTQLGGKEKDQALKELDAQWGQARQQMDQLRESGPQTAAPGAAAPGDALARGKDMIKQGLGAPTGPAPAQRAIPPERLDGIKAWIQAHPDQRGEAVQKLQEGGFSTEGL